MKKGIIILMLLFIIFGVCVSDLEMIGTKVVYELNEHKTTLTADEKEDVEYNDDISLQILLALEDEFNEEFEDHKIPRDKTKRHLVKEFFNSNNNQIFKELNITNYKKYYISEYTPYIEVVFDREYFMLNESSILKQLEVNSFVSKIYVKENYIKRESSWSVELANMTAYNLILDRTYTGEGVTVGILEPGVIDVDDADIAGSNYIVYDNGLFSMYENEHTTTMATFIGGNNGIAPDATILSIYLSGSPSDEIDWMIENDVDIINMSYGENNATGVYNSESAYMDYVVKTYGVIMVAAAGNNGETTANVCNPGLGYNVITVGTPTENIGIHSFSSYNVVTGSKKPTIGAPGYCVKEPIDNVNHSGTSVSAALTSGILALLLEQYPVLKGSPERVMALITSSAKFNPFMYAYTYDNGFYPAVGAGMLNYANFCNHRLGLYTIMNINGRSGTYIYTKNITLTEGELFKASIAWTAYATGDVEDTKYTNYNLILEDPEGNIIASGESTDCTIELVLHQARITGNYKLRIYQQGAIKKINEMIAISHGPGLSTEND